MLRNFGKFILYLILSCAISGLAYWTGSDFINKFSESILPLLSAILAINITTSALLSGEIKKYISNIPNSESCFDDTIKEIKWTFKIQIFLLCILFVSLILKEASFFNQQDYKIWTDLISNAIIVGIFGYFLEIIYDLGVALFQIIETNRNN